MVPAGVEFAVLGTLEVRVCGDAVDLGRRHEHLLLLAFLLDYGRSMPRDLLADRVWGDDERPAGATASLYSYLSRLRRMFAPATEVSIIREACGYRLRIPPESVDAFRFQRLLAAAAPETCPAGDRIELLDAALRLWRGTPFSGFDLPWLTPRRTRLEQQHLTATLDRNDLMLCRGGHEKLLPGLWELAADHPFDERVAGQLIRVLYRCGRQDLASGHYHRIRKLLVSELGLEPGPALRQIHERILSGDADFTGAGLPIPRQLPAPPQRFVGRMRELSALAEGLCTAGSLSVPIVNLVGAGGIGKTALALRWAHAESARFPDGQLYADLCGFDTQATPVEPEGALRSFLQALGADVNRLPPDQATLSGLYRSLLAGKRMLVVLDNARDSTQVAPLLPGEGSTAVILTSRRTLDGIVVRYGARPLELSPFDSAEARLLLSAWIGCSRLATEPNSAAALIEYCGGLPLALTIVASQAAAHPQVPLSKLVAELADPADRLDLGDPPGNLRSVLLTTYLALVEDEARVFRLLGLVPGPSAGPPAIAALVGCDLAVTRRVLRRLEEAHLVHQFADNRFGMHDLVRTFAIDCMQRIDDGDRAAAIGRLLDCYLCSACAADRVLEPDRPRIAGEPAPTETPLFESPAAAMAWFDAEHACLLALQETAAREGRHREVWQLAWALLDFHRWRGLGREALATWKAAAAAAEHLPDPTTMHVAQQGLGLAELMRGNHLVALRHFDLALKGYLTIEDLPHAASAHLSKALALSYLKDYTSAADHAAAALDLSLILDNEKWVADARNALGWYHALLADLDRARDQFDVSMVLYRRNGSVVGQANVLEGQATVDRLAGRLELTVTHLRQALELYAASGYTGSTGDVLIELGDAYEGLGRGAEARAVRLRAAERFRAQGRNDLANTLGC